jgi:hypothetical protein
MFPIKAGIDAGAKPIMPAVFSTPSRWRMMIGDVA